MCLSWYSFFFSLSGNNIFVGGNKNISIYVYITIVVIGHQNFNFKMCSQNTSGISVHNFNKNKFGITSHTSLIEMMQCLV